MDCEPHAINRLPSAEDATEIQSLVGALVRVQLWANVKFATVTTVQKLITTGNRVFIYPALSLEHPGTPLASKFFDRMRSLSSVLVNFEDWNEYDEG